MIYLVPVGNVIPSDQMVASGGNENVNWHIGARYRNETERRLYLSYTARMGGGS